MLPLGLRRRHSGLSVRLLVRSDRSWGTRACARIYPGYGWGRARCDLDAPAKKSKPRRN